MTGASVVLIDGAPGAGKTYQLRQKLSEHAEADLSPTEFYWLNFTNSGRRDVEPEIREVFPDADDVEDRAKTFHGLALSLALRNGDIDDVQDQIIQQGANNAGSPYREFAERQGMAYNPDAADPSKLLKGEKESSHTANLLYAINEYLQQTCKEPMQWTAAPINPPVSGDAVVRLLESWDAFKREHYDKRRYEHSDYIHLAHRRGYTPDVSVLLVDEFQDLAPAEYRLYKLWRDSGPVEKLYVAGDPNQAIYSFRGATPYYFQNTDVDDIRTLTQSRRCPVEIAKVGNRILSTNPDTDPRGFDGERHGGTVEWSGLRGLTELRTGVFEGVERYDDADPAVMLLVRFNHQLRQVMRDMNDAGIPYNILGNRDGIWAGEMSQMLMFLNNWKSGGDAYVVEHINTVLDHLPESARRKQAVERPFYSSKVFTRKAVEPAFNGYSGPESIIRDLQVDGWKRDALQAAVAAPAYLSPSDVRVGTIHAAKGLEAPVVYLFAESTDRQVDRYGTDPDAAAEEHRVYYVGATRASSRLQIVDNYFDTPTAPPLAKALYEGIA
jgi:DNA helicase-2/ATP-dependent DNA helicase PcrA